MKKTQISVQAIILFLIITLIPNEFECLTLKIILNSIRLEKNRNEWWTPIFVYFPEIRQICFKYRQNPYI